MAGVVGVIELPFAKDVILVAPPRRDFEQPGGEVVKAVRLRRNQNLAFKIELTVSLLPFSLTGRHFPMNRNLNLCRFNTVTPCYGV